MFILIFSFGLLFAYLLFNYLLKQSKKPTGFIGIFMMRLWNKVYFPMVRWSLSNLEDQTTEDILDVGIGNGLSTAYLKISFPNSTVYGIDISADAIKQARKKYGDSAILFEVKSVEQTAYDDHSFDLICAFQNHFHWENMNHSLVEIKRLLKEEGRLLIACEATKISYYLPNWQNQTKLQEYLASFDLQLIHSKETNNWVAYYISPRNTSS